MRPRALDLFCCAGGASLGLVLAGFDVVGVDLEEQPRYPWRFLRADALSVELGGYDLIWASPPCQRHSKATKRWAGASEEHPDLIAPVRARLQSTGALYIIENVPGAPLESPVTLCGSMFRLGVQRHRLFEANFPVAPPPSCDHSRPAVGVYGHTGGSSKRDGIVFGGVETWREAMGIWWMSVDKLSQAIPPAYAEWLGLQARLHLMTRRSAA